MLDINDNPSVTVDVPIYDTFVVGLPAVTMEQVQQLQKACREVNRGQNYLTEEERDERYLAEHARRAPDLYIRRWGGLTLRVLAHLGITLNTVPELVAEKTGSGENVKEIQCVAYTPEIARQLWTKAYRGRFRDVLMARASDVLEAQAVAERDRGNS